VDRVLKLVPDQPDALRDRGLAYLQMDHARGAREDLSRYLQLSPNAADADALRDKLVEVSARRTRMH
jgi:regulator of sirC expression with transglutaminase-like and TPR domain